MSSRRRKSRPPPLLKIMDVEQKRIAAILERTRAVLDVEEHATLTGIVDTVALMQAELQCKDTSLERLRRMIFGAITESTHNVLRENRDEPPTANSTNEAPIPRAKRPGHGRNAAAAYTGAEQVTVAHPKLHGGQAGLSGLHEREAVCPGGAWEAGTHHRDGAVECHGLQLQPAALQPVRGGVHRAGARGCGG